MRQTATSIQDCIPGSLIFIGVLMAILVEMAIADVVGNFEMKKKLECITCAESEPGCISANTILLQNKTTKCGGTETDGFQCYASVNVEKSDQTGTYEMSFKRGCLSKIGTKFPGFSTEKWEVQNGDMGRGCTTDNCVVPALVVADLIKEQKGDQYGLLQAVDRDKEAAAVATAGAPTSADHYYFVLMATLSTLITAYAISVT